MAMIVGKDFIFCHVAKTGGTSIRSILENMPLEKLDEHSWFDEHDILLSALKLLPDEIFKPRFKFGFVRNPFDRELSNYFWHTRVNVNSIKDISFKDWVEWRYNYSDKVSFSWWPTKDDFYYNKGFAKRPQIGHFVNSYGDILADYIGRFETINEDWAHICSVIGVKHTLPHHHKTEHDVDYRKYYTSNLVDIVGNAHQLDLMAFNYDFEHGLVSKKICSSWRLNGRYDLALASTYNYAYG